MTIQWQTSLATDTTVEWGPTAALGTTTGNTVVREKNHAVTLTGLTAGSTYSYRVLSSGVPLSSISQLATAALPSASSVTALVFGDSGQGTPEQMTLAGVMKNETFDLALHLGDVIYPNGEAQNYDPNFFVPYAPWLRRSPCFPAFGNHDDGTASGQPYLDAFTLPANNPAASELYYSFDWGDVHFVSIDTWKSFRQAGAPLTWLDQDLAATTRRWKVVTMHVPLDSIGTHGDDAVLQSVVGPVFEKWKVDLVLAGHDHHYERSAPIKRFSTDPTWPGYPYIISGGGGATIRAITPRPTTLAAESAYHYVVLTFTSAQIQGKAVRMDGTVIESFTIPHAP